MLAAVMVAAVVVGMEVAVLVADTNLPSTRVGSVADAYCGKSVRANVRVMELHIKVVSNDSTQRQRRRQRRR